MVLYPAVSLVYINPAGSHDHPARDARAFAQGRLSLLLALEIAPTGRATADRHGAARVDPTDERRKSALGRADRVPNKNAHFRSCALTQAGSPDPRNDRICITSSCPRQFVETPLVYAAVGSNLGSLNRSPRTIMAQAMRAILLANATAATLTGLRSMIRASHSRFVPCCRAYRMTAMAPVTRSHRKYRLPCFEILPRRSLPPVECCLGTSPIQAAKLRPDENSFQSPTSATRAVATSGPRDILQPPAFFT